MQPTHRIHRVGVCWGALLLVALLLVRLPAHPAQADTLARLVKDINVTNHTPSSQPLYLTAIGNTIYFVARDGVSGDELWRSDGTAAGTTLVKDIAPGAGSAGISGLTAMDGTLC